MLIVTVEPRSENTGILRLSYSPQSIFIQTGRDLSIFCELYDFEV